MRDALGFVLDFTAVFVAMGALAGALGAVAFALLFDGATFFHQCMDLSSPGPAMASSDRRSGTGVSGNEPSKMNKNLIVLHMKHQMIQIREFERRPLVKMAEKSKYVRCRPSQKYSKSLLTP